MFGFKCGDVVEVISQPAEEEGCTFYHLGDIWTVIEADKDSIFVDFNTHQNNSVIGDGRWFVNPDHLE